VGLLLLGLDRVGGQQGEPNPAAAGIAVVGVGPPHLHMVLQPDHQGVGEHLVDDHQVVETVPRVGVGLPQSVDTASGDRHAMVAAPRGEVGPVAVQQPRHGVRVQPGEVVGLVEGLERELPVEVVVELLRTPRVQGLQPVPAEPGDESIQVVVVLDGPVGARVNEHHPADLENGKRHEAARRRVDAGERHRVRDRQELTVEPVRPAVVRAHQRTAGRASLELDRRAAVAAHVEEGANPIVTAAHQHHGRRAHHLGEHASGVGQLAAERHELGYRREDVLLLERCELL
jgi:hypothetical protein